MVNLALDTSVPESVSRCVDSDLPAIVVCFEKGALASVASVAICAFGNCLGKLTL